MLQVATQVVLVSLVWAAGAVALLAAAKSIETIEAWFGRAIQERAQRDRWIREGRQGCLGRRS